MKFGVLQVVDSVEMLLEEAACKCQCGNKLNVNVKNLLNGTVYSCGCIELDLKNHTSKKIVSGYKNGRHWDSPEYRAWTNMKKRCMDPSCESYANYGGRGVKICRPWVESFLNFINDMGARPTEKHSIDRIDVNGNYTPQNCRWATNIQQSNNRRNSIHIQFKGKSGSLSWWSKKIGVSYHTIYARYKRGLAIKEVLNHNRITNTTV